MVLLLARPGEVVVDHLPNDRRPVREARMLDFLALRFEVVHQTTALRAFTGAVEAFKDDEMASTGAF